MSSVSIIRRVFVSPILAAEHGGNPDLFFKADGSVHDIAFNTAETTLHDQAQDKEIFSLSAEADLGKLIHVANGFLQDYLENGKVDKAATSVVVQMEQDVSANLEEAEEFFEARLACKILDFPADSGSLFALRDMCPPEIAFKADKFPKAVKVEGLFIQISKKKD